MNESNEKLSITIFEKSKNNVLNFLINNLIETNKQITDLYNQNSFNIDENDIYNNILNKQLSTENNNSIDNEFTNIFSLSENSKSFSIDEKELLNNINETSNLHIKSLNNLLNQLDYNIIIDNKDENEEDLMKTIYNSNSFEDDIDEININKDEMNNLENLSSKYQLNNSNNDIFSSNERLSEYRQDSKSKFDLLNREFKTSFLSNKNKINRVIKKRTFTLPNQRRNDNNINNNLLINNENIKNFNAPEKNCIIF
jgi:hypothetical protein